MPELPEVETIARDLRRKILDQKIEDITVYDARVIRQPVKEFTRALKGRRFKKVSRRGKALILELDNGRYFVVQLMMTGQLIDSARPRQDKVTKVSLRFSNGRYLHYNDQRLFGRLQVVDTLEQIPYFNKLGPEPLTNGFSPSWLAKKLKEKKVPIKALLMDHTFVAGIGNIYASEILFQSRINPKRPAHRLKKDEVSKLHAAARKVLTEAIRWRGTSMNNYRDANGEKGGFIRRIKVYGRENEDCSRCKTPLSKILQRGRSTFFCPRCQR
jgi:formamidopyrimidine-DNA glycosylase